MPEKLFGQIRIVTCLAGILFGSYAYSATIEQQREWYEQAQAALEEKDNNAYQVLRNKLDSYPLVPYLDYRQFNQSLSEKTPAQVDDFVNKYESLPFSTTVRSRYLSYLASSQRWREFVAMQPRPPKGQVMQCHYYYAKSELGKEATAWSGTRKLWLTGNSLNDACDPLLEKWEKAGKRTDGLILDRMLLVYGKGNKSLLEYLDKQLSGSKAKKAGDTVLDLFDKPQGVADFAKRSKVTPFNQSLTEQAYKRLVRRDVREAVSQYPRTVEGQHLTASRRQALADYTASRLMATDDAGLQQWRDKVLAKSKNTSLLERRVRQSMREDDWKGVELWVKRLPAKAKQTERWRFWQARLAAMAGDQQAADKQYRALLGTRNFYSAAAATVLGEPITYPVKKASDTAQVKKQFGTTLARIKELVAQDKFLDANREWHYLLRNVNKRQAVALASYASASKWHHLAVQATISGRLWDHIPLRFPVAHKWWFDFFSKKRDLPVTTMMALARQESAMNVEARSPVGARGLMQLMPATARETAKKLGRNYQGKDSLFDPGVNIRLGSGYLKMMLERYDNNRIFAFAAYNAGPSRVTRWREQTDGRLDAYAFIEAIPFNETRGYVQNILMFEVYYGNLTGVKVPLLKPNELATKY
ncbi:lytic transglycosylase [Photobacterium aquae]|uniref:Lytic transglycosylase n=1 Tax=Photobacterium aquae TaxID=1195763 RepID=A0A0J1GXU0_9GAMM|nr:lytic transglycosylase [Photobacterium aquae]